MKKFIVVLISMFFSFFLFSQNCKYEINDIDKFTKQQTKITKSKIVISTFYTSGAFKVKKIDSNFYFIFDYSLSSYSQFEPYNIDEKAKLIFLLENGETITLACEDNIKGEKKTVVGIPPVYVCNLTNASYKVTRKQLDQFLASKVVSIRFYRTESNGKEDYVDNDIKTRSQEDIIDLIKCVI